MNTDLCRVIFIISNIVTRMDNISYVEDKGIFCNTICHEESFQEASKFSGRAKNISLWQEFHWFFIFLEKPGNDFGPIAASLSQCITLCIFTAQLLYFGAQKSVWAQSSTEVVYSFGKIEFVSLFLTIRKSGELYNDLLKILYLFWYQFFLEFQIFL